MSTTQRPAEVVKPKRYMRAAWLSLALFPLTGEVSLFALYTVLAFTGYSDAMAEQTPWWSYVLAVVVALAVLASPFALIIPFSNMAKAAGEPDARLPLVVAGLLVGAMLLVKVGPMMIGTLVGGGEGGGR